MNLGAEEFENSCETLNQVYLLWSDSMFGHDPTHETSAWIVRNTQGTFEWQRWPASRKYNQESWNRSIPRNVVAQFHTHASDVDPRPSTKDLVFSKKVNIPLYTVSRKGIWKVTPEGKITRIAKGSQYLQRCQLETENQNLTEMTQSKFMLFWLRTEYRLHSVHTVHQ
jgi:proteasome lid subunit RPN8/RPN11